MILAALLLAGATSVQSGPWSDPATWGGAVPLNFEHVDVGHVVTLTGAQRAHGVDIHSGAELVFVGSGSLESSANVVVRGLLDMEPSPLEKHRLTFVNVNEAAFVGGGDVVVASDVGLWVVDGGRWVAHGTQKTPWTHLVGSALAGATGLVVDDAYGWRPGDEIVVAPTSPPTVVSFASAFERLAVIGDGGEDPVLLSAPLALDHFAVEGWTAETLNLTRNVVIEGTPGGRAHIDIIDSAGPVDISYVEIRHMGPRQAVPGSNATTKVLGRYPLHIHHGGDALMGSLLEGISVHDTGSHAYVAHAVNGVTIRDSLSFNTREDAFWYDPGVENGSDFLLYDHDIAALVLSGSSSTDRRLTAFRLGSGEGNEVRNSVAVGVQGRDNAAGFQWPEASSSVWQFSGNLTHNNIADGVFVWQNGHGSLHVVGDLAVYHVGDAGIEHGAYFNAYQWQDVDIYGAGVAGVALDATSGKDSPLTFRDIRIDGSSITPTGYAFRGHNATRVDGILVSHRGLIEGGFVKGLKIGGVAFRCAFAAPPAQNWFDLWTIKDVDVSHVPIGQHFEVSLCKPESSFELIQGKSRIILHTTASTPRWGGFVSDLTPTFPRP